MANKWFITMVPIITVTISSVILSFLFFAILAIISTVPIFLWHVIMCDETAIIAFTKTRELHLCNFQRAKKIAFFIPKCLMVLVWVVVFLFVARVNYLQRFEEG